MSSTSVATTPKPVNIPLSNANFVYTEVPQNLNTHETCSAILNEISNAFTDDDDNEPVGGFEFRCKYP